MTKLLGRWPSARVCISTNRCTMTFSGSCDPLIIWMGFDCLKLKNGLPMMLTYRSGQMPARTVLVSGLRSLQAASSETLSSKATHLSTSSSMKQLPSLEHSIGHHPLDQPLHALQSIPILPIPSIFSTHFVLLKSTTPSSCLWQLYGLIIILISVFSLSKEKKILSWMLSHDNPLIWFEI